MKNQQNPFSDCSSLANIQAMEEMMTTLSQEEQDRRREAWRQANSSVLMEGGQVTDTMRILQEQHILGKITFDEYTERAVLSK